MKQHLSQKQQSDSTRVQVDFDAWFKDVNVTITETGHCYATETVAVLLKFDLIFSRQVAKMYLLLNNSSSNFSYR